MNAISCSVVTHTSRERYPRLIRNQVPKRLAKFNIRCALSFTTHMPEELPHSPSCRAPATFGFCSHAPLLLV